MRTILVTGANGQLGRAIQKVYAKDDVELICSDLDELDITNVSQVLNFVRDHRLDVIINCAAYTNVDKAETDFDNAFLANAIGPRNLAIAATEAKAKLVHLSTDYVFRGDKNHALREYDKPDPISAYGRTKLLGENFVKDFADRYFIIRTAWLYGEGHNFVRTMLSLSENHETVSVVNDQFGNPTSADELAKAIRYLEATENYGVFHGTCEGETSWSDFAKEIFALAGKKTEVIPISTEEYGSATKRPAFSMLENYMFNTTTEHRFADWHDAIAQYIRAM